MIVYLHRLLLLVLSLVTGAILILLVTLISIAPFDYSWVNDNKVLCSPRKLDSASISYGNVTQFAVEAVTEVNSYDYLNWDTAIPVALGKYFTADAGKLYYEQFKKSNLLKIVQKNYYTVSTLSYLAPVVVKSRRDLKTGAKIWDLQIPVTFYYQTGVSSKDGGTTVNHSSELLFVSVIEQSPSKDNSRGVGILNITSTKMPTQNNTASLEAAK